MGWEKCVYTPEYQAAFVRDDFELQNKRALTLHCSMWRRQESPEGGAPCVIYLHGNASCRAEALQACMHGCCRG